MKAVNSYVFIPKEEKEIDGHIKLKKILPYIFEKHFNIDPDKMLEKELKKNTTKYLNDMKSGIRRGSFDNDGVAIDYKFLCANGVYYLDISINNNKANIIKSLAEFNNLFLTNKEFNKGYIPIISYDYVSENYCNILFPLLNIFERKIRKLLFLIFTSQFKELYFEKTATDEMIKNAKEIIKRKKDTSKEEYRIQNYFYSLDMATLRDFLFDKQWTIIEEEQKENLLKKDLSKLSNEKLKEEINNIGPKSNWDRFFQDKGFSDDIDDKMKNINDLRNLVAHNKIIDENDYNTLKSELEKMIKEIDKAIKITESVDFIKINKERYSKLFIEFANSLFKMHEELLGIDYISKSLQRLGNSLLEATSLIQNARIDAFLSGIDKLSENEK